MRKFRTCGVAALFNLGNRVAKDTSVSNSHAGISDRVVDIVDDDESVRRALWRLLNSVGVQAAGRSEQTPNRGHVGVPGAYS